MKNILRRSGCKMDLVIFYFMNVLTIRHLNIFFEITSWRPFSYAKDTANISHIFVVLLWATSSESATHFFFLTSSVVTLCLLMMGFYFSDSKRHSQPVLWEIKLATKQDTTLLVKNEMSFDDDWKLGFWWWSCCSVYRCHIMMLYTWNIIFHANFASI